MLTMKVTNKHMATDWSTSRDVEQKGDFKCFGGLEYGEFVLLDGICWNPKELRVRQLLQYRSESNVNCSGVLRTDQTDQDVFYFLTMSLGSSQTVFTHDEKQLPSPKVGTQLRVHGDYASTVFPVVCAGFFSRFSSF